MRRRTRLVSSLVVLFAFTASVVEAAWAGTCEPGMEMGMERVSAEAMSDMAGSQASMPAHERNDPTPGEDGSDCPFGPVGTTQGCAAAASLPAPNAAVAPYASVAARLFQTIDDTPHRLSTTSIFHPPRP